MVRALLFDLDETLLDRGASLARFIEDHCSRLRPHPAAPFERWVSRFIELDQQGCADKHDVYRALLDEFAIKGATAAEMVADFRPRFGSSCRLCADAVDVLRGLRRRGFGLGVVTNGSPQMQRAKVEETGLARWVDTLLISEEEGVKKPDPQIFFRAADRLGVHAPECAFIGDNPVTDICGAHQVGMHTVWYTHGSAWPAEIPVRPTFTITRLSDLLSIRFGG
jgi:putative hydrolase of the HAD superfamily